MLFELPGSAQHRQQHRRTLDGRLCAAAFVFDRQTHVGCSDGTNPAGEHGREWCYVDAQVAHASSLGVQCVCVCVFVCVRSVFRYCNACSYWTVVVGSLRGVIAVIHFMRRFGEQRACTVHFNRCHGTQSARLCLQRLVKPQRCCGMPRHARSGTSARVYCASRRFIHDAPCSGRLRSVAVASPQRVCIQD